MFLSFFFFLGEKKELVFGGAEGAELESVSMEGRQARRATAAGRNEAAACPPLGLARAPVAPSLGLGHR